MIEYAIENEDKVILNRYRRLLRKANDYLPKGSSYKIGKAFRLALKAHKDVRRKSGEPYIFHPLAVATIIVDEMRLGSTSIIASLLHDVVEDTEYSIEDIKKEFGGKISEIVDGLTKFKDRSLLPELGSSENFSKLLIAFSKDIRVIFIKIADRLDNMRTLGSMPRNKQLRIQAETNHFFIPIAHRLGLYDIKSELEDLCLKYSHPKIYDSIVDRIETSKSSRRKFIKNFIEPIEKEMVDRNFKFEIKSRVKSISSIYKKMKIQNVSIKEVYDLFAIRIIIDVPKEVERASCWEAYSIVTNNYNPNSSRLRDWISRPRSNGYESLHVTVMSKNNIEGKWVEVQIRTIRMDDIAEKGYAAHWRYKNNNVETNWGGIEEWIKSVRQFLDNKGPRDVEFLDDLKRNLYISEVIVFTPKGEIRTLPKGSTVVDFAFDIHTEVGARCVAAKIGNRLVPLNYVLTNADQVKIITSNKINVSTKWISYVKTSKAREAIQSYLRKAKEQVKSMGKEIVQRKFRLLKIPFNSNTIQYLVKHLNMLSETDLYSKIGEGIVDPSTIRSFKSYWLTVKQDISRKFTPKSTTLSTSNSNIPNSNQIVINDKNVNEMPYTLSKCCNPIPGDFIFGFFSKLGDVKIHRTDCNNSTYIMAIYGHRIVDAKWSGDDQKYYNYTIKIQGTDRFGIASEITNLISKKIQTNIKSFQISAENDTFKGTIIVSVKNKKEVTTIVSHLESMPEVEVIYYDNN